jgi:hypothetical protein
MKYILFVIVLFIIVLFIIYYKNVENFELSKNKKTIVFSLTCHECDSCVYDLILNIQKCFNSFNIILLISISDALMDDFNITMKSKRNKIKENIRIVTVRNSDEKMWGHMNLFHQHMLNVKYCIDDNIDYDYFWLVASNEMFIKKVSQADINFIHNYKKISNKYSDKEIEDFYNDYEKHTTGWDPEIIKNYHMIEIFKKNKMKIQIYQHEGLVLPKELMNEIYIFYTINDFYNNSDNKGYIMEEVLVGSYLDAFYKFQNFHVMNLRYNLAIEYKDLSPYYILKKALDENGIYSIKPVKRDTDDELRKLINNMKF